ncbi:MAG TPA: 4-alpha-glucanotransferase [Mobilitalea sp.]|nr:4-alpha-glucanotransferase [Mobilitalea sp.]
MINQVKQQLDRGAGVLMPISAIPSPYGIGSLGEESYRYADFLERIGCRYWQVLPVVPTSFGDSPYQSFSAFAGNPYFIDLDYLINEGLITNEEVSCFEWMTKEESIDYSRIYKQRFTVLKKAYYRSGHADTKEYTTFCLDNEFWLEDYCLYMALKEHFNNREWLLWDKDIRDRHKEAVTYYQQLLKEELDFWKFCQFKFHEQWNLLKEYANKKDISMIGDIPLYVAMDSSDVWVHGELFELDERKNPINVAGVPPDAFSDLGQRWGNPLYRWDVMEQNDFSWWRERMNISANLYDVIRIDHFIGVVNYYSIPVESPTAVTGEWRTGPGKKLTDALQESICNAKIIAEDLGVLTPNVKELIAETGYPGMRILEFGLGGPADHEYLPHNYKDVNIVAYTGTHDNETLAGFLQNMEASRLEFAYRYFGANSREELVPAIIRSLYASIADVVIVQMQDLLGLDNSARMNLPATIGENWKWRMKKSQYNELKEDTLLELARIFARTPKPWKPEY